MFKRFVAKIKASTLTFFKMSENSEATASVLGKRPAIDDAQEDSIKQKKKKVKQTLGPSENKKRKIALLAAYNGKGYYGVQIQKGFATIEKELFSALVKAGAWFPEAEEQPSKMWFQRGSRTDKGVSAAGQTFSLLAVLVPDLIQKLNDALPPKIRIINYVRTTKTFDAKNYCDSRTYMYMIPTFAFADIEQFVTTDYRIEAERINHVREILNKFKGTHNFHNFTSGVKFAEKRANRYILSFECSEPYVRDGMEFMTLRVHGQSFMLHQIRKMIGITIAIVRGYCGAETIDAAWKQGEVDVPKAPGLGLVLEQLHFSGYNKKFANTKNGGFHDPIEWSACKESVDQFKEEHILSDIVAEEKSEKVMFNWLRTLQYHNFGIPKPEDIPQKPWAKAKVLQKTPDQKVASTSGDDTSPLDQVAKEENSDSAQKQNNSEVKTISSEDIEELETNEMKLEKENSDSKDQAETKTESNPIEVSKASSEISQDKPQ